MEYKTNTELELLQGYFTAFNGMLSDISEDVDVQRLHNAEAFNRVLSGMRKLCSEFNRYAREEHSASYERQSVDYDPEDARVSVPPQGGEVEAYIDPDTGRRIGIDAKGREWIYTPEPEEIEEERYTPPAETPEPVIEEEASVPAPSVVPSAIGGTMLDNYTWYKDEKINGDARDIFTWILKADPRTCSPEEFIEGLLYARLDKAGKAASLTQRELVDLVLLRSFPGYPTTVKGVTDKVRAISKQLKTSKDFTKKGLEEMTKRGYPTASFYTQAHIDALEAARAPCSLSGDDLDGICELIAETPVVETPVVETPVVEEEATSVDVPDAVTRARALLGL